MHRMMTEAAFFNVREHRTEAGRTAVALCARSAARPSRGRAAQRAAVGLVAETAGPLAASAAAECRCRAVNGGVQAAKQQHPARPCARRAAALRSTGRALLPLVVPGPRRGRRPGDDRRGTAPGTAPLGGRRGRDALFGWPVCRPRRTARAPGVAISAECLGRAEGARCDRGGGVGPMADGGGARPPAGVRRNKIE